MSKSKKNAALLSFDDLKVIWRVIARNWYIPVIFAGLSYLVGYFYTYKLTNVYQVSTQLMLNTNEQYYSQSLINEAYAGDKGDYGRYVDNTNEAKVIQSYDLLSKVVDKIKDRIQVSYFIVGKVRTTEYFTGMPFLVKINSMNSGLFEQRIKFNILDKDNYAILLPNKVSGEELKGQFGKELITESFNLLIAKENNFSDNSIDAFQGGQFEFQVHSIDRLISQYQSGLVIENPDYTNILKISCQDVIPDRAKLFLDTLAKIYIDQKLESKYELNERTLSFIDKQMAEVSSILKDVEDTMQNFKSNKVILDLVREENNEFEKLSAYESQRSLLNLQIEAINDLEKYIVENKDPEFLPPSVFVVQDDPYLVKTTTELYQKQIEYSEKLSVATDKNQSTMSLRENIKKLKQDLLIYINNSRKAYKKIIENVTNQIGTHLGSLKSMPGKQRELNGIQRKVDVNQNLYIFLLQKRASTYIARASIIPDSKVIESPRMSGLIWPNKGKINNTYAFVGLALGVVIVLLRVLFFTTLQTVEELKEVTSIPILGELPYVKNMLPTGMIVDVNHKSRVAEAFRTLRTNLQYLNVNKGSKVVLITSNSPGEGKTFASINMSAILAKAGKKTLLLELDLHKPRVQKALEMEADIGISTVIIGQTEIKESIKKTIVENLDVMLSGPIPPNPSEMILSDKLKEIIDYGKENYDYVIIDTPPAGLISDSIYLMQYCDISLFVLNTKFATKRIVSGINELIEKNNVQHFSFILNGVRRKKARYYYNKYGYGYGYGYGGYGYGGYGYGKSKS
ncbi:MAG: polysaccharide biosynthesis tyrosine autokinase [Bacteroidota bacterium]|nr:polysaccharide biosynthesis tyrosine autokinase [Bacteroidota bacterium]